MVQVYISQLRKVLGGSGNGAEIVTRGRGYELRLGEGELDVRHFERLLAEGSPRGALALWGGPPLDSVASEPFAPLEIRRLEGLRLAAVETVRRPASSSRRSSSTRCSAPTTTAPSNAQTGERIARIADGDRLVAKSCAATSRRPARTAASESTTATTETRRRRFSGCGSSSYAEPQVMPSRRAAARVSLLSVLGTMSGSA
jgi:hypothetical protein